MSEKAFRKLWPGRTRYHGGQTPVLLRGTHTGSVIVSVEYGGQRANLPLIVVQGNRPTLLSRS